MRTTSQLIEKVDQPLALLGGPAVGKGMLEKPAWPPITDRTANRLREVYESGVWSFHSPAERAFAEAFARHHDAPHGIFMSNGTVTLECALAALGVGPGDEVIVPALTWPATAMAAHYLGATPVFVDVEPTTLCLDPAKARAAITDRTRAIIPVHIYGSMADLDAILELARSHGLAVIEDCAHMQGGRWAGRGVGSWGHAGSFSFQESKTMSAGEGGLCLTREADLAERIFRIKHIGYAPGEQQGRPTGAPPEGVLCHNYRATAFQAAVLEEQLEALPARLARYNAARDIIESWLHEVPGVRLQARGRRADLQGYYGLVAIFDEPPLACVPRERIRRAIRAEGLVMIDTYGPVYRHALYNAAAGSYRLPEGGCPVAEHQGTERALVLLHQHLNHDEPALHAIGAILAKLAVNADALRAADL